MKFFIDTGDTAEIKLANDMGIIDGVTTNPSLVAKAGKPFVELIREICAIVDGPVSAEVVALDAPGMIKEGRELAKLHKNVVVKVPLTEAGLVATKAFSRDGIHTNVTLCFSANQALLAAKAGATYISPFIGRLDDVSFNGMDLIKDIRLIYNNYNFKTEILAASIRHPVHVLDAAKIGADVATCPLKTLQQLVKHPLTDAGPKQFLADWEKRKQ
ncbi:MAG: fructose-6-phosphate aldolase [Bdellovibrionota bacterium]